MSDTNELDYDNNTGGDMAAIGHSIDNDIESHIPVAIPSMPQPRESCLPRTPSLQARQQWQSSRDAALSLQLKKNGMDDRTISDFFIRRYEEDNRPIKHSQESKQEIYSDLHHLTKLPDSIKKFVDKAWTVDKIEAALQAKILQHTSRDSDRFRQVLRLFKEFGERDGDASVMSIDRTQFQSLLRILGLFTTREQANQLFDRYDSSGQGKITVHDFLTRCRPRDYFLAKWQEPGGYSQTVDFFSRPAHKRQYLGIQPKVPGGTVCTLSLNAIAQSLREKLRINRPVGEASSVPRSRRDFAKIFEWFDKSHSGSVTCEGLRRSLDAINFPLGESHLQAVFNKFSEDDQFHYHAFIEFVFPDITTSTSLHLNGEIQHGKIDKQRAPVENTIPVHQSVAQIILSQNQQPIITTSRPPSRGVRTFDNTALYTNRPSTGSAGARPASRGIKMRGSAGGVSAGVPRHNGAGAANCFGQTARFDDSWRPIPAVQTEQVGAGVRPSSSQQRGVPFANNPYQRF